MEASFTRGRDDALDVDPRQFERTARRAFTVCRGPQASLWPSDVAAVTVVTGESSFAGLIIPEGWTLEPLERQPDHALVSTPAPSRYSVTLDLKLRGFRGGYSTIGRLVGEEWNKKRKKYGGRGWKQQLVDDAVASLQGLLR